MAVAISEGFKTCPEALLLRNIEKTQKRCKKVLTEGWGCGIILERQGPLPIVALVGHYLTN